MSRNKIILSSVAVIIVIIVIYSLQGGQTPEEYIESINNSREEQQIFMKNSAESPFIVNKVSFTGLKYFVPDPKYKVKAKFESVEDPQIITLSTSDGKERQYLEYGYALFELEQSENKLLILEDAEEGRLFLAFGDATSADETYGAGRYLDVKHSGGNSITLDFNMAYNPYCAYVDNFSCPFPPKQNLLTIAIRAGEKNYK